MSHGPLGNGKMWATAPSVYFDDAAVRLADFRTRSLRWYRPSSGFPPLTRSWQEAAQRWAASSLGALALLILAGCASLTHEPGTAYGGPYCTQRGGDPEPACYHSEAERSAAWHQREAEGRKAWAAEHPDEARAAAAERTRMAQDFAERQRAKAQEATDQAAARVQDAEDQAAARATEAATRQAEATRLELARTRTTDPAYAVPALSALLCQQQTREAEFRADLQREVRITAISGVVDKRSRSSLAAGVVDAQDRSARLRMRLHAVGGQPLPCAAGAPLLACRAGDEMACRSDPSARDTVDVLRELEREPWRGVRAAPPATDSAQW